MTIITLNKTNRKTAYQIILVSYTLPQTENPHIKSFWSRTLSRKPKTRISNHSGLVHSPANRKPAYQIILVSYTLPQTENPHIKSFWSRTLSRKPKTRISNHSGLVHFPANRKPAYQIILVSYTLPQTENPHIKSFWSRTLSALLYNITPVLHQTITENGQIAEAWRERTAIDGAKAGPGTKPA